MGSTSDLRLSRRPCPVHPVANVQLQLRSFKPKTMVINLSKVRARQIRTTKTQKKITKNPNQNSKYLKIRAKSAWICGTCWLLKSSKARVARRARGVTRRWPMGTAAEAAVSSRFSCRARAPGNTKDSTAVILKLLVYHYDILYTVYYILQ